MITNLIFLHAASTATTAPIAGQENAAWNRVKQMVKRYQGKLCAEGTIDLSVQSNKDSLSVKTTYQYLAPSRVYINQVQSNKNKRRVIISDGTSFVYFPDNNASIRMFELGAEPVKQPRTGKFLSYNEIHIIGSKGLLDNSMPLDIVMGRPDNIPHMEKLFDSAFDGGRAEVNGETVRLIKGKMRGTYILPPHIDYTMAINANNDLVQMVTVEEIKTAAGPPVSIRFTWNLKGTVNDEKSIKSNLFELP